MRSSLERITTPEACSPCSLSPQVSRGIRGSELSNLTNVVEGVYPYNTLILTWVTNNLQNEHVRSVGIPLLISIANISGVASSQIYPASDKPRYIMGNSVSLGMKIIALIGLACMYLLLRWRSVRKSTPRMNEDGSSAFKFIL
jgi:hypothetical protein